MLGIHLEGPFISAIRAGAQPVEYITNLLLTSLTMARDEW